MDIQNNFNLNLDKLNFSNSAPSSPKSAKTAKELNKEIIDKLMKSEKIPRKYYDEVAINNLPEFLFTKNKPVNISITNKDDIKRRHTDSSIVYKFKNNQ